MTKTKYFLPSEEQQKAIDAIMERVKDHDRLYTEDGDYNRQGKTDMAVGKLITTSLSSTYGSPHPTLWTKPELNAIYNLGYRLSEDGVETRTDDISMLQAANTVFSLHDHDETISKSEYYKYRSENYYDYRKGKWRNKFKRLWYKFLSKVTRQSDTE